ncbi:MAG: signal transduction histidine kinase [Candidatus Saccharimonadales bacterium]|jgi:signal transduction histidine kinase
MGTVFWAALVMTIPIIGWGLLVYSKNTKATPNKLFLLQSFALACWSIVYSSIEAFSLEQIWLTKIANNASDITGMFFIFSVVLFTFHFPKKLPNTHRLKYFVYLAIPVSLLSLTEFTPATVSYDPSLGVYVFEYTLGMIPYIVMVMLGVTMLITNVMHGYKSVTTRKQKHQSTSVISGLILSTVMTLILALVWPFLVPTSSLDDFAPFAMIIYLLLSGRAIIQARLYDFKAIIIRMFSYFAVILLSFVFYLFSNYLINTITSGGEHRTLQIVFGTVFTGILILMFYIVEDKIYKYVVNLTSKDSYDPQNLLSDLNKSIVSSQELEVLLRAVASNIAKTLNTEFCGFYIRETSYFKSRFISNIDKGLDNEDLENIRRLTQKIRYKIHSSEVEPANNEEELLNEFLNKNKIEILGRLVDTTDLEVAGIGYMLIGSKNSGSVYSEQDLKILEIIANELVIAVENTLKLEEIELFNSSLQKKIDSATKQLKLSNEELKELDDAKDEFISMASHQLRTPLTSIKGYLSLVLEGDAGKITQDQEKMLEQAFFSSQRMVYLISDLLNVSRLKTGKFVIDSKPVYLPDLVETELTQLYEGAKAKDLTLSFIKPKKFANLNLDELKLRQVVTNMTDNAIYYTPTGGKITVSLRETAKSVEFTVKDTGIGVPKDQIHKLFGKFFRADNARNARPDGTGLGLFMAKKVIVAQGGSVILESKEGKGSTFGFSFPKDKLVVDN